MTSSNVAISAHNSTLAKKFQGNGWTLTCSTESRDELSVIIGDELDAVKADSKPAEPIELPLIRYESDWADTVVGRSMDWKADDGRAPLWLTKATEGAQCALFQLPPPDHRWVVKLRGKILEPFNYRMAGWSELHEIMEHGFLLDRSGLIAGETQESEFATVRNVRTNGCDLLRSAELIRTINNQHYGQENQESDAICYSMNGTRLRESGNSKTFRSCADDFHKQVRDRLDRVFTVIKKQDEIAASVIKRAVRFKNSRWSFNDSVKWMTSLGEIPYDASMVLSGRNWEIDERAICAAMRFKPSWFYRADHQITEDSELHTVCGLPTGMVTLARADALEGVRDLIKRQRARLYFCSEPTAEFKRILADIEAGIIFARKQEKLLEQVQPRSEEYQPKIQKAIYRTKTELEKMGDWTTRYDRLANHLSKYIRGGMVLQYTGPYCWKIEGIAETPNTLDMAADHMQFKRNKVAKTKRRAKTKTGNTMRSLKVSTGLKL